MPSAPSHRIASLYYLGQYTPWLQKTIDIASQGELKGAHHLLFHDYPFIQYLDKLAGREIAREALLHIILDVEEYRPNKMIPIPKTARRRSQ